MIDLKRRLEKLEAVRSVGVAEVIIHGGLPGPPVEATRSMMIGGHRLERKPGETFADFRARVRTQAETGCVPTVVWGGLPVSKGEAQI